MSHGTLTRAPRSDEFTGTVTVPGTDIVRRLHGLLGYDATVPVVRLRCPDDSMTHGEIRSTEAGVTGYLTLLAFRYGLTVVHEGERVYSLTLDDGAVRDGVQCRGLDNP